MMKELQMNSYQTCFPAPSSSSLATRQLTEHNSTYLYICPAKMNDTYGNHTLKSSKSSLCKPALNNLGALLTVAVASWAFSNVAMEALNFFSASLSKNKSSATKIYLNLGEDPSDLGISTCKMNQQETCDSKGSQVASFRNTFEKEV